MLYTLLVCVILSGDAPPSRYVPRAADPALKALREAEIKRTIEKRRMRNALNRNRKDKQGEEREARRAFDRERSSEDGAP